MKVFSIYIKKQWGKILFYLLFSAVFFCLFFLYQIPLHAAVYAVFVGGAFGIAVLIFQFIKFRQKYIQLERAVSQKEFLPENLPKAEGGLEAEYEKLVERLYENIQNMENIYNEKELDMLEYYTLWVHQIKTPIASMYLKLQGEDSEFSREIGTDLMRIEQYVEMVLCYLRLDSSEKDYVFREYSLDSIIKQAVRRFAPQFIRKKIKLEYETTNAVILTDEKWLLFVLEQLLSNSLKYTKPGGCISLQWKPPQLLVVKDTGIGIAKEDLPRIFEKGYTGYNGREDKKASGIGLYLCKRICEKLGYGIWAESEIHKGTEMILDLKRKKLEIE